MFEWYLKHLPANPLNNQMAPKAHGSCLYAPPKPLRWNVDYATADQICCFNRHYAEQSGYFVKVKSFMDETKSNTPIEFLDTVTGKVLFRAPQGRSMEDFIKESRSHGWPSFRDGEVDWTNVRIMSNGETVSVDGTHLGHNLPDGNGNRYCINLVSVAGVPSTTKL